jgi:hypothetical protein
MYIHNWLMEAGDPKTTKHKVFWIHHTKNVPLLLKNYTNDYTEKPIEVNYVGEEHIKTLKCGDKIELMRLNYYICDKQWDDNTKEPVVLISVPHVN